MDRLSDWLGLLRFCCKMFRAEQWERGAEDGDSTISASRLVCVLLWSVHLMRQEAVFFAFYPHEMNPFFVITSQSPSPDTNPGGWESSRLGFGFGYENWTKYYNNQTKSESHTIQVRRACMINTTNNLLVGLLRDHFQWTMYSAWFHGWTAFTWGTNPTSEIKIIPNKSQTIKCKI